MHATPVLKVHIKCVGTMQKEFTVSARQAWGRLSRRDNTWMNKTFKRTISIEF